MCGARAQQTTAMREACDMTGIGEMALILGLSLLIAAVGIYFVTR